MDSQLTLTDIIRQIGRDGNDEKRTRSTLSRFLENQETAALLGASGPVRPTFPQAAVPVMAALLEASERGEVTPKMGAVWLARHFPCVEVGAEGGNSRFPENGRFREIEKPENRETEKSVEMVLFVAAMTDMRQEMRDFVAAVKEVSPIREDIAITRAQAALLLTCAPRSVSRYVRPIRRGVYRRSDCLRYVATGKA